MTGGRGSRGEMLCCPAERDLRGHSLTGSASWEPAISHKRHFYIHASKCRVHVLLACQLFWYFVQSQQPFKKIADLHLDSFGGSSRHCG